MKRWAGLVLAAGLWAGAARAQSPVTLTLGGPTRGPSVPDNFAGLSFETLLVAPDAHGGHIFSRTNKPLIALFKTLGIHSLRIGGNTADLPNMPIPGPADIDPLFTFAKAARVKVIYTLRLRNGDPSNDIAIAQYIEKHDKAQLDCFAIGNEPEYYRKVYPVISNYPAFRDAWKKMADAVSARVPGARWSGPCAGEKTEWSRDFARDFHDLRPLVTQHDYPGGSSHKTTNAAVARERMLSSAWLDHYGKFYNGFATTALSNDLAYRLEEVNNFSDGGVKDASDTFAAALWSLEYLHWWAAHGASGINFHGRRWVPNCIIHPGAHGHYAVRPMAYGIKAFELGGHGCAQPLTMDNPDAINLTAYAVRDGRDVFVTIINKGPEAKVALAGKGTSGKASVIFLTAPDGDVAAKTGIILGDASIEDDGSWNGKWTRLKSFTVTMPSFSAAIVKIN